MKIKNKFHVINFNDHIGQFKGAGTTSEASFWKYLFNDVLKIGHDKVVGILDEIAQIYLSYYPENNIQIDSFFYVKKEVIILLP